MQNIDLVASTGFLFFSENAKKDDLYKIDLTFCCN